ncbi:MULTISPECIES: DNA polymerase [unclassified Pseudoclavibacter]|uniref:DNA polymerase n=1 Tax=unclassified Pseudoclavibacter TaxID=2615177 RepID=UPI001BAA30CC|nr:DNA polymerase [Pseudoclavibacter sp. Marseille-Q4354]MBS3180013.1 hypothetical protein [Pseudoclavibacter sp. Marseille-Q4354]
MIAQSGRECWARDADAASKAVEARCGRGWDSLREAIFITKHGVGQMAVAPAENATARATLAARWNAVSGEKTPNYSRAWITRALEHLPADDPAAIAFRGAASGDLLSEVATARSTATAQAWHGVEVDVATDRLWRAASRRGYQLDVDAMAQMQAHADAELHRVRAQTGVDARQPKSVKLAMRDYDIVPLTADGQPALDSAGLPSLDKDIAVAVEAPPGLEWLRDAIARGREAAAVESKLKELRRASTTAGRVHPRFHAFGAVTGRMTVAKPAMQNFPKLLRPVLLADAGMTLVGADLSSVEPRVACILSGDQQMASDLSNEVDIYCTLAQRIWGEPIVKDDPRRDIAKTSLLATIYGQGTRSLAAKIGFSQDDARAMRSFIDSTWPQFAAWRREVQQTSQRRHPLFALSGRRLAQADEAYKAVNYMVQGSAADLYKAMVLAVDAELAAAGLPGSCWLPVHDELTVQVPIGAEQVAVEVLKKHMTTTINGVTISAAPKILGPTWGHP